ncbi:MAG: alpha/beta hydrolase [Gammaproteobacteria bacterium]|jgi:pimeloyl-ACP methyl ester carboxylesterase
MARFDSAVGRYVYLEIAGVEYRVYFEENGRGTPLLLQHTAGADARQWRHVLEDAELATHFRMIAYDLPFHGKSVPPTSERWWAREYRLTRAFLESVPVALKHALALEDPLYMGSSIGGHLAIDLALDHPEEFRAVVGLEAASHTPGGFTSEFYHPEISNDYKAHAMYGLMSPTSPEAYRRETVFVYSQGAPAVFKGDLYYYSVDHDVRESAAGVDTSKVAVAILNGEYDWSGTPERGRELAALIPGATYQTMERLGHFPMSEDPERFLDEIRPVLLELVSRT